MRALSVVKELPGPDEQSLVAGSPLASALGRLDDLGAPVELLIRCKATARMQAALALAAAAAQSGLDIVELEPTYASAHRRDRR